MKISLKLLFASAAAIAATVALSAPALGANGDVTCTGVAPTNTAHDLIVPANGSCTILFGSQDDRLYCLEPDGHLRWSVELGGDVDSSPTLAADGTIFVGSDDRKLYALRAPNCTAAAPK